MPRIMHIFFIFKRYGASWKHQTSDTDVLENQWCQKLQQQSFEVFFGVSGSTAEIIFLLSSILPVEALVLLYKFLGLDKAMDAFHGKRQWFHEVLHIALNCFLEQRSLVNSTASLNCFFLSLSLFFWGGGSERLCILSSGDNFLWIKKKLFALLCAWFIVNFSHFQRLSQTAGSKLGEQPVKRVMSDKPEVRMKQKAKTRKNKQDDVNKKVKKCHRNFQKFFYPLQCWNMWTTWAIIGVIWNWQGAVITMITRTFYTSTNVHCSRDSWCVHRSTDTRSPTSGLGTLHPDQDNAAFQVLLQC